MYYQNYEDYIRTVLGYPMNSQDTYSNYNMQNNQMYLNEQDTRELESLYPDLFKALNPAIVDVCSRCNEPITRDKLEDMVEEVYSKIQNNEINVNINIINDSDIVSNSREAESTSDATTTMNKQSKTNIPRANYNRGYIPNITNNESMERSIEHQEKRQMRPQRPNNQFLRDLIKILILNRLIHNRPNRPRPPRPPFPGEPRPPMPPRPIPRGNYDDYLRF